jgi:hypothetical protein
MVSTCGTCVIAAKPILPGSSGHWAQDTAGRKRPRCYPLCQATPGSPELSAREILLPLLLVPFLGWVKQKWRKSQQFLYLPMEAWRWNKMFAPSYPKMISTWKLKPVCGSECDHRHIRTHTPMHTHTCTHTHARDYLHDPPMRKSVLLTMWLLSLPELGVSIVVGLSTSFFSCSLTLSFCLYFQVISCLAVYTALTLC